MKKVLSVDNNPVMLKYLANLMTKEGHDVITAEDGLSALEISKHGTFRDPDEKPIGHGDIHPRGVTRELLAVKQHFEVVLERMSEGLMEITGERRIIYTNSAALALTQLPLEKIMGTRSEDPFNPEDGQQIQKQLKKNDNHPQTGEKMGPFTLNGRLITLEFLPITGETPSHLVILTDITERLEAERALQAEHDRLPQALSEVNTLSGLLPICASCKKIRDDKGYWNQIEAYIRDHSEADFSHGICPDCARKLYPELYDDLKK